MRSPRLWLRAVVIDMTTAYELQIGVYCPNAQIVHDLFDVVAEYDRDPDGSSHQLRHDRPARKMIKSSSVGNPLKQLRCDIGSDRVERCKGYRGGVLIDQLKSEYATTHRPFSRPVSFA